MRDLGRKNFETLGKVREGATNLAKEYAGQMKEAVTGEPKTKLEASFQKLEDDRAAFRNNFGGGRGGDQGGQGRRGGQGGPPGGAPAGGDGKGEKPAPPPDNF